MIHHVVLFSAKSPEHVDAIFEGLQLLEQIPDVEFLRISKNLKRDQISDAIDVVVFGLFRDEAQLEAYKAHSLYAESIARVRPLRNTRAVADFVCADSPYNEAETIK